MKKIISLLVLGSLALANGVNAQNTQDKRVYNPVIGPQNQQGTYVLRNDDYNNRVLPFVAVDEDDVYWYKEYKSVINLKVKKNQVLYYPTNETRYRKNFAKVMFDAILTDKTVTPYVDEYFEDVMSEEKLRKKLFSIEKINVTDWETGEDKEVMDTTRVLPADIVEVVVREEKFFDKKRSVMDQRIIGMAPVALIQNKETLEWEKQILFWFYYPQARQTLANAKVYNEYNAFQNMSMDELFLKRLYTSRFIKESNLQDRTIGDYNTSKRARLLEAERIKEELRNFEHDLWNY
ncbi:MAG: gliding motility protein GldN [Flavobacteriales bacterium]